MPRRRSSARTLTSAGTTTNAPPSGTNSAQSPPGTGGTTTQAPNGTQIEANYAALPLEPNLGQTAATVQDLSHGPGFVSYLTAGGSATLELTPPGQSAAPGAAVTRQAVADARAPGPSRDALR